MALPDTEPSDKKSSSEPHKGPDKKEKPLTKVIVRRLPPNMDSDTFLNQISPVPTYDYFYMVKGDASLGENSFSRAYINFTNANDIYDFKEKFDNYVFLDNAGHEFSAVVEFAAFQKIPKKRHKVRVDPKVGTIESDPYYLEFVEMLNKPSEPDEKPEYTYQINADSRKEDASTPLLEFIKHKRAERLRIREERREERKKKEFERKRYRDDERKKRFDEKSPKSQHKGSSPKEVKDAEAEGEKAEGEDKVSEKDIDKYEKSSTSYYKNREKKYEDRKKDVKSKYPPKKEYADKREFKSKRDDYKERSDYRSKYDDYKKDDTKVYQKKVKKYSEKREERKIEAQKAEQKKLEQQTKEKGTASEPQNPVITEEKSTEKPKEVDSSAKASQSERTSSKNVDESGRRIRNKDRPTIAIYRPGMLSKRKQQEGDSDFKDCKKE